RHLEPIFILRCGSQSHDLLVAQGFDGVEFGGFHGRPNSKEEANTHADDQAGHGSAHRDAPMPLQGQANQQHQAVDKNKRDDSAGARQSHGFQQKLPSYVLALGADGFADTDLAGALSDAAQHDIHSAHAADEQTHGAEHYRSQCYHPDNAVEFLYFLLGGANHETILGVVSNVSTAAEKFRGLID